MSANIALQENDKITGRGCCLASEPVSLPSWEVAKANRVVTGGNPPSRATLGRRGHRHPGHPRNPDDPCGRGQTISFAPRDVERILPGISQSSPHPRRKRPPVGRRTLAERTNTGTTHPGQTSTTSTSRETPESTSNTQHCSSSQSEPHADPAPTTSCLLQTCAAQKRHDFVRLTNRRQTTIWSP